MIIKNKKSIFITFSFYILLLILFFPIVKNINFNNYNPCLNIESVYEEKKCYEEKFSSDLANETLTLSKVLNMPLGIYKNPYIKSNSVLMVRTKRELELYVDKFFWGGEDILKKVNIERGQNTVIFKKNNIFEKVWKRPSGILVINSIENKDILNYEEALIFTYYKYLAYLHPYRFNDKKMEKTFVNFVGILQTYRKSSLSKEDWDIALNEIIVKSYTQKEKAILPALFLLKYIIKKDDYFLKNMSDDDIFYFSKKLIYLVFAYNYYDIINNALSLDLKDDYDFIIKNIGYKDFALIKKVNSTSFVGVEDFGSEYFLLNRISEFNFKEMYTFLGKSWNNSL